MILPIHPFLLFDSEDFWHYIGLNEKKTGIIYNFIYKRDVSMKPTSSKSASEVDSNIELCIAEGCGKAAISHPEWDNEYCSIMCCYTHCKRTFQAWLLANRKQLTLKMNTEIDKSNNQKSTIP